MRSFFIWGCRNKHLEMQEKKSNKL